MQIVITGQNGLAKSLAQVYSDHDVKTVSRSTGYNIANVHQWAKEFSDADMFVNCAYYGFYQVDVLETFATMWKHNKDKTIINIGSKVTDYTRSELNKEGEIFSYRYHKQALQSAFANLVDNVECNIRLYNLGPFDSDMIKHLDISKMSLEDTANKIKMLNSIKNLRRADVWL